MNKETKVGLLVGLSFIVLFGVILSGRAPDMPSTPEKTMVSQARHPRTDNVQVVRTIELPTQPNELAPAVVDADGTNDSSGAAIEKEAPAENHVAEADQKPVTPNESAIAQRTDGQTTESDDAPVAQGHADDQQIVDAGEPNPDDLDTPAEIAAPKDTQMLAYTIKKGDTLAKIARTVCGDGSSKTIDRIYEANRDKMTSKAACVVGKTLQIPIVKKDKNTDTLLQTGKFEEIARGKPGKQPTDDAITSDDLAKTADTKTTEVAKPADKATPKDAGKTNPKNSIKGAPKDALAQHTEPVANEAAPLPKTAGKNGGKSDPKGALAGALEQVTQQIIAGEGGTGEAAAPERAPALALSVQKETLRRYQVQKGDTWYKMAAKFMGDAKRWKELYALNDDIFPDATKLRTGVKIRVPVKGQPATESVQ